MGCCFTNIKKIVYKTGSESDRKGHMINILETLEKKIVFNVCFVWQKKITAKEYFFLYL